jgi:hypothetical protein
MLKTLFETLPKKPDPSQWRYYTRSEWRFVFSLLLLLGFGVAFFSSCFKGNDSYPVLWKITVFIASSTILQIWA